MGESIGKGMVAIKDDEKTSGLWEWEGLKYWYINKQQKETSKMYFSREVILFQGKLFSSKGSYLFASQNL